MHSDSSYQDQDGGQQCQSPSKHKLFRREQDFRSSFSRFTLHHQFALLLGTNLYIAGRFRAITCQLGLKQQKNYINKSYHHRDLRIVLYFRTDVINVAITLFPVMSSQGSGILAEAPKSGVCSAPSCRSETSVSMTDCPIDGAFWTHTTFACLPARFRA